MSRATAVRGLSFLVAIVACAWFAVGIRQSHDTAAATAILSSPGALSSANAARAASLLDGAALLNPDRQVGLLRSQLTAERGQRGRAARLALQVAHAEPLNARAWLFVDLTGTPAQKVVAARMFSRLIPRVR